MAAIKILLILSVLSTTSYALLPESIAGATQALSNAGHESMALTIEFGHRTIIPPAASFLTIFSPPDVAFTKSGQPSLSLLHFHFSPLPFSLFSLKSLPHGSKIPTLSRNRSLTVTSSAGQVSLNGVEVDGSPIYDDGSLTVFGTDSFFDPGFKVSAASRNLRCGHVAGGGNLSFEAAVRALRMNGCSLMAAFLELQLSGLSDPNPITVFAPSDKSMWSIIGDPRAYRSIFLRHLVPCKLSGIDFVGLERELELPTYLAGFDLELTPLPGRRLVVNGIEVSNFDMFNDTWISIHGVRRSFAVPGGPNAASASYESSGEKLSWGFLVFVGSLALCFF